MSFICSKVIYLFEYCERMQDKIRQIFSGNTSWVLLIIATAAIGFWPVLSGLHPLKYDAIDYYFPSRHLISQFLASGEWPLWAPYQNLGYPLYADPQSGAWYPVSLLLAAISSYPLYMIHLEFFIHVVIAGVGMFFLIRSLLMRQEVAFMAAVAYMLSGFFVGNAQHLTWLISAAWLPVVLNTFLHLLRDSRFIKTIPFALALFMMFSGGYPAFIFIVLYLLLILWIVYVVMYLRSKEYRAVRKLLLYSVVSVVMFLAMAAFILISEWQVMSWMSRGSGVTLQTALFGAFPGNVFISFISPYSVAQADMSTLKTDISMANGYFGLIPWLFVIPGIFIRKSREVAVIFWFGVICLLAATGDQLPVRALLYRFFPLMDLFRFPSAFRLFFIFGAILLAAFVAHRYAFQKKEFPRVFKMLSLLFCVGAIVWVVVLRTGNYLNLKAFIKTGLFHYSAGFGVVQHQAIDLIVAAGLLLLCVPFIFRNSKVISVFRFMVVLATAQMIFSVWTNAPYTAISEEFRVREVSCFVQQFPQQFPPMEKRSVLQNEQLALKAGPFWRNLNLLNRQIAADGFTPFKAKGFETLQDSFPQTLQMLAKNQPAYCTRHLISDEKFRKSSIATLDSSVAICAFEIPASLQQQDTSAFLYTVTNTVFRPQQMSFSVQNNQSGLFVLQQNRHPGWQATVDGAPAEILPVNFTEMALMLPAGQHQVSFEFIPSDIRIAWMLSMAVFALLLLLWVVLLFRKGSPS